MRLVRYLGDRFESLYFQIAMMEIDDELSVEFDSEIERIGAIDKIKARNRLLRSEGWRISYERNGGYMITVRKVNRNNGNDKSV